VYEPCDDGVSFIVWGDRGREPGRIGGGRGMAGARGKGRKWEF